ncbi:hypothetical protein GURKE_01030 [Brevundimonas phage vB_BpoS-Gurke]|uniref:Uncharacterized protein n=1 Tax=Brevundimonas phage vB_BpoS-Gurke TaxID=2948599 RepID=A0A9E7N1H0_9CAUD|nr:hypothetical protein GURKE_01030 [Brevundimonas phage vB_BpoS-Gurke]
MHPAALAGIQEHGHRWRYSIRLRDLVDQLKNLDELVVGDVKRIINAVAPRLHDFIHKKDVAHDLALVDLLEDFIDYCHDAEDDPDEVKNILNDLYDIFDFNRILVI